VEADREGVVKLPDEENMTGGEVLYLSALL